MIFIFNNVVDITPNTAVTSLLHSTTNIVTLRKEICLNNIGNHHTPSVLQKCKC